MCCTSIEKNYCGKCLNQQLTDNSIWLLFYLLHGHKVHLSIVEWVGLLPGASTAVPILSFRALRGIVSILPALETGDMAQIPLGGCGWSRAVLIIVCSIPIPILGATVVVGTSSYVGVASMVM